MEYLHSAVGIEQSLPAKVRNDQLHEIMFIYGKLCRLDYLCDINDQFNNFLFWKLCYYERKFQVDEKLYSNFVKGP